MTMLIDFAIHAACAVEERRGWTPAEELFLRQNLRTMTHAQIGQTIGRTTEAVKIRAVRTQLPAPSKHPGWLTGHQAARILCIDIHCLTELARRGHIKLERLPGMRGILQIKKISLWVWAINPENWIYFKPARVRDPRLRRLIQLRAERWGDEWWSTGQIARFYGLSTSNTVNAAIHRRGLPARRWANWWVKRSDALAHPFYPGKGGTQGKNYWSARADSFLLEARDEWGLGWSDIGRLMKWPHQKVAYRYGLLTRDK